MPDTTDKEKVLREYEKHAQELVSQMFNVLVRAGRKKDDTAYRKILEKIQKER